MMYYILTNDVIHHKIILIYSYYGGIKETMRKIRCIFVALLTLLVALALVACGDTQQEKPADVSKYVEGMDDFEYYANDETVTLFWPKDKTKKSVTVPACVTEINDNAFDGCVLLEEVKFEKGSKLKKVNTFAFKNCVALKSISFPTSLEALGDRVFYGCSSLETVEYDGDKITSCGTSLFEKCSSLKHAVVPAGMANVSEKEFADCTSLTSVVLSEGITAVGDNAFKSRAIESVTLPSTLTAIGNNAFCGTQLTSVTIPSSVTSIGENAFGGCVLLEEVKFENGSKLKKVNTFAFKNCVALKSISFPTSLEALGDRVFYGCSSLETVEYDGGKITSCGTSLFEKCSSLKHAVVPAGMANVSEKEFVDCTSLTSVVLSEGITAVGDNAFKNRTIESVTIPSSVTSIGESAFERTSLTALTFASGSKLTTIGARAFYGTKLTTVTIPSSVTSIGANAFFVGEDVKLQEITVPFVGNTKDGGSLLDIFGECDYSQTKIRILGGQLTAAMLVGLENATVEISKNVDVKAGSLDGTQWFANQPDGVVYIGDVVYGYKGKPVASLSIKEGTTKILDEAILDYFKGGYVSSILPYVSLYLPSTLSEMGKKNFFGVPLSIDVSKDNPVYKSEYHSLLSKDGKKLILSGIGGGAPGVETICEYAGITLIERTITIPKSVKYVERFAFPFCKVEFESGSNLISVGDYAFFGTGEVAESTVLDLSALENLKSIGKNAFGIGGAPSDILIDEFGGMNVDDYISVIETVKLPKNLESIGMNAFGNNLKNIEFDVENGTYNLINNCLIQNSTVILGTSESVIPAKYKNSEGKEVAVTSIGDYAFAGLDVSQIVIPSGIEFIGNSAFESSKGLLTIENPQKITSIGARAFYGTQLTSVTIPSSVTSIGESAFEGTSLTAVTFTSDSKLTDIGARAFFGTGLTTVTIPTSVTSIGESAFEGTSLTAVTFATGSKLTDIGARAFYGTDIIKLTIPSTVVSIGEEAFAALNNLEYIEFEASNGKYNLQSVAQNAFETTPSLKSVAAPMGILSKFKDCFSFVDTITVTGNDDIPAQAFSGWVPQRARVINVGEGVRKIGDMAFVDCQITSFALPASVTEIGNGILMYCPIESLSVASGNARYYAKNNYIIDIESHSIVIACKNSGEIPTSFDVTSIANGAFKSVEIDRITIPGNVKSIGDYAFEQSSLVAINILSGVESIGRGAFDGATNLASVSVADSVKSIGYAAFRNTEFYAKKQVTEKGIFYIGKVAYAYHGDKNDVVELEVADGTVGIAEHAFERMSNLKKITLPSSLKQIDKEAFVGCKNLTNLYFNGTDEGWKAVTKVRNWNLNLPKHKTWTLCRCEDKSHDHDGDGIVKKADEAADVCQNYKLLGSEVCDECFDKEVDKAVGKK